MAIQSAESMFAPIGVAGFVSDYLERDVLHLERQWIKIPISFEYFACCS
jgi:hypothetical protein